MKFPTLPRRAFLRAMGLVSAGAALPAPFLYPRGGYAQGSIPKRVLFFHSGSGVSRQVNVFRAAGGGVATETDFVFPEVRSPLNAIREQLITFENLDMVSATVDPTSASNAHYNGETHCLAATNRADGEVAGGPSLDQYIAAAINSPKAVTKVPSLQMAVQTDGNVSGTKVCTAGSGQVIPLNPNPEENYNRLFAGFTGPQAPPAARVGDSPAQIAAKQQKSVLDLVLGDFDAVRPTLGKADQEKLDAHASAVRDLEMRIQVGASGATGAFTPGAGCADPTRSILNGSGNSYPGEASMYRANFDAMARIVQAGFACDLTRVVLMNVGEPFGSDWGYNSGDFGSNDAHDLIHKTSYGNAGTLKGDAGAMAAVQRLHQLECVQFVTMLDLLRQIPEADGKSLLDHTIVVWSSQIAEHGHDVDQLPWILAGGSEAGFKPGRFLKYPRNGGNGAPHNNLFVSIAQGTGLQLEKFGNESVCTGPLDRLRV